MKIFILDQHKIVIDGLIALLHKKRGIEIAGYSTNLTEAKIWLSQNKVDLVITEIMFHDDDSTELIKLIKNQHQDVKILILTGDNRIKKVSELFKLGVHGFIEKHNETKNLVEAIKCVTNGDSYLGEDLRERIIQNFSNATSTNHDNLNGVLDSITNRELEIIKLICEG